MLIMSVLPLAWKTNSKGIYGSLWKLIIIIFSYSGH